MATIFVIHGGSHRSEEGFAEQVKRLREAMGGEFDLRPVWYGSSGVDLDLVRRSLPYAYPPAPDDWWEGPSDTTTIEQAEAASRAGPPPGWANIIWHGRKAALENFSGISADVMLYLRNPEEIRRRVRAILTSQGPGRPVYVVGHSLGGIIAVDLAAEGGLEIDGLVTFGSQSSVVQVLDPTRWARAPFEPGKPIVIAGIRKWINLWNKYDPIAFAASKVFALDSGDIVDTEVELRETKTSQAHSAYWVSQDLGKAIRDVAT